MMCRKLEVAVEVSRKMGCDEAMSNVSKAETHVTITALVLFVAVSVVLSWRALFPAVKPTIDTRLQTGEHLTLVLVAPTTADDREYIEMVGDAISAMRLYARKHGYHFSTVGVSDDWAVSRGLEILAEFGPFDEVVVGRNWFNTGVERYITEFGAQAAVPLVAVFLQERQLDTTPWVYGESRELIRVVGRGPLGGWSAGGFAIP